MSLVLDVQESNEHCDSILPAANTSSHCKCPLCQSGAVNGILIDPLCFDDVERAIVLKKNELPPSGTNRYHSQKHQSRKHAREEDIEIQAESPYLLLSNSNSSISCSGLSRGQQRTGRWTNEESALVEFLVTTFDQGLLPLPHGIKLNEFLGDMLLCKSSRLTKKMKNAKLSTRSFVLGKPCAQFTTRDREKLSMLQESFLSSLSSESTRLVLKMNLAKQWRTHFYNICLQIGYPHVQEKAWNTSLQELEKRATRAEEIVRRIRRRKMGLSQQYDGSFINPNPVFDLVKADQTRSDSRTPDLYTTTTAFAPHDQKTRSISHVSIVSNDQKRRTNSSSEEEGPSFKFDEDRQNYSNRNSYRGRPRTLSTDISISSAGCKPGRNRSLSDDFDALLDVLTEETTEMHDNCKDKTSAAERKHNSSSHFCRPLLNSIVEYLESNNLPFQHVDLWVPSFSSGGEGHSNHAEIDQLSLCYAGFNSRRDINNETSRMLQEFGVYSSYFSFEPGKGIPGRVFVSGVTSWEYDLHNKDPNHFGRVEGAELYGVKTALAIPLNIAMVGRVVAVIYSCDTMQEDASLAREIAEEISKYSPEPKWKMPHDSNVSSNVQKSARSSQPKNSIAEELDTKSFSNFPNGSTTIAHGGIILDSTKYSKDPDSAIVPNSSPNIPKNIKSLQIPMMPTVQHESKGLSRISSNNEIHTTHYLHKASKESNTHDVENREDRELASFLNQNMPVINNSLAGGQVPCSSDAKTLRPYFLSCRLLLLRPSNERTARENEIIRILKKSFRAYARDNRRDGKELANLLVKDWVCLKSTYSFQETTFPRKKTRNIDGPLLPATRMSPSQLEPYKSIPPPEVERQIAPEYHGTSNVSSMNRIEPPSQQFVSDSSEVPSDQSSRVSESSSSSSSKLVVDHKRYLPRRSSSVDSVQYTSHDM